MQMSSVTGAKRCTITLSEVTTRSGSLLGSVVSQSEFTLTKPETGKWSRGPRRGLQRWSKAIKWPPFANLVQLSLPSSSSMSTSRQSQSVGPRRRSGKTTGRIYKSSVPERQESAFEDVRNFGMALRAHHDVRRSRTPEGLAFGSSFERWQERSAEGESSAMPHR